MMRIIFFIIETFTNAIHSRSDLIFRQLQRAVQRFEFTYKNAMPAVRRDWQLTKSSVRKNGLFWMSFALLFVLIGLIASQRPIDASFEHSQQGYYIQTVDMDLKTMFGQAPDYIAITPDGQTQQLFGCDANVQIVNDQGDNISIDDIAPGSELTILWNGEPAAPSAMAIQVKNDSQPQLDLRG